MYTHAQTHSHKTSPENPFSRTHRPSKGFGRWHRYICRELSHSCTNTLKQNQPRNPIYRIRILIWIHVSYVFTLLHTRTQNQPREGFLAHALAVYSIRIFIYVICVLYMWYVFTDTHAQTRCIKSDQRSPSGELRRRLQDLNIKDAGGGPFSDAGGQGDAGGAPF